MNHIPQRKILITAQPRNCIVRAPCHIEPHSPNDMRNQSELGVASPAAETTLMLTIDTSWELKRDHVIDSTNARCAQMWQNL
ncbi:hypothetical protein CEXT_225731 [Caerostris extrusa]|uniref:Uncharacterized protein n=1 Tax=Caerostris extrusa TaxID=172846 RepID=A0AAV4YC23_CAEEX|nr:hypothetical protein CEXT_225731 [Caerostris extrusa]